MKGSKSLLRCVESKGEEFGIGLQKWQECITKGAVKGTAKIYTGGNNIYS